MFKPEVIDSERGSNPLCLEFANTLHWHASEHPEETLHAYVDLVTWAQGVGLMSDREARKLLRDAADRPVEASRVHKRAVSLREAIYRIFVALIQEKSLAEADLAELNNILTQMTSGARVAKAARGFAWSWDIDEEALDSLIGPIALSAAELLISEERERVGQCADDRGCGWLFLDTSKNRSRRWCDINDCGNRAKQRRHYQRMHKRTEAT